MAYICENDTIQEKLLMNIFQVFEDGVCDLGTALAQASGERGQVFARRQAGGLLRVRL